MNYLTENLKVRGVLNSIEGIAPQLIVEGTTNGSWVSLAKYDKILFCCQVGAIAQNSVLTFQVQEAYTIAAGGAQLLAGKTCVFTDVEDDSIKTIEVQGPELTQSVFAATSYSAVRIQAVLAMSAAGTTTTTAAPIGAYVAVQYVRESARYAQAALPA